MRNFKLFLPLILGVISLVILESCSDDVFDGTSMDSNTIDKRDNDSYSGYYSDGMLNFETLEDVRSHLLMLEENYEAAEDKDDFLINSMQEKLGQTLLEAKYGANMEKYYNEEISPEELEEYNNTNWFKDEMKMLMLNEHYELGVGDDVYVWYSPNQVYQFPKSNQELRTQFQTTIKNNGIPPTSLLYKGPILNSPTKKILITKGNPITEPNESDPPVANIRTTQYLLSIDSDNVDCQIFDKEVRGLLEVRIYDDNGTPDDTSDDEETIEPYDGDFTVDYGDGNVEFFDNTSSFSTVHTYSNTGTFSILISVDFIDLDGVESFIDADEMDVLVEGACSDEMTEESFWEDNGGRAMSGFLRFDNDIAGKKFVAKTIGWRWDANKAKWKKEKGALLVIGEGIFRNDDCIQQETKKKSDSCGNCKDKRIAKHAGFLQAKRDIMQDDVQSSHMATFSNGSQFVVQLSLDPCS